MVTLLLVDNTTGKVIFAAGECGKALEVHDSRGETEEVNNTKSINPEKFSVFFWIKRLAESTGTTNITFKLY